MTRRVVAVGPAQWLTEATMLMKSEDLDALPVVSDEQVIGIVSDRDIVIRVIAEGLDPHAVRVDEVASRELVTVRPEQDVDDALQLMDAHEVRQLPVVEEGRLVGIISRADIAAAGEAEGAGGSSASALAPNV
jgi:CBS domain-containing protein